MEMVSGSQYPSQTKPHLAESVNPGGRIRRDAGTAPSGDGIGPPPDIGIVRSGRTACGRCPDPYGRIGSERLHDDQDDDQDHQNGRHLVDDPEEVSRFPVVVIREGTPPFGHRHVCARHRQDQNQLRMKPAL